MKEDALTPLCASFTGYSGLKAKDSSSRYLWFTENSEKVMSNIPVYDSETKLVILYNTNNSVPGELVIERYEYMGYTVGGHFFLESGGRVLLSSKDSLPGTYMRKALEKITKEDRCEVVSANGKDGFPISNIDTDADLLLGLEQGKLYEFGIYRGTRYETLRTIADTQVFKGSITVILDTSNIYEKTKEGYFIVRLPALSKGYYYINGEGMMYYDG